MPMAMYLLDIWEEIGRMRESGERRQLAAVNAGDILATRCLGQVIGKIITLDWDIRVAESEVAEERNRWKQQVLARSERNRFGLALAELAEALGFAED